MAHAPTTYRCSNNLSMLQQLIDAPTTYRWSGARDTNPKTRNPSHSTTTPEPSPITPKPYTLNQIMWARDAREEVRQCYRREGVNHLDNCKEFVQAYLAAIEVPFFNGVKQNMAKISALDKEDAKKD
ncbi:hypothetical protein T484DRAFT_2168275 [Baffinella frigidus]|nr:hypothetical protein T484DRAFT_2168275 [Cryptophyta sp. CCMP2293]